ncbi:succinate dehydrogenase cytochrome b560 subunit, mitochondrial [Patella vulgata]|uniref:succinate dehydrogenase cytochrome b560 subunit, mitochondrial n=1 Tax=Patella vulgata TaxID=6465 RepID=UPI00218080F3|nr:succinate dehydrogenase cytochrome b560 subunit, mitochondrial [Patella vulgata]
MAMLVRSLGKNCLLRQQLSFANKNVAMASSAYDEMKVYWDKNKKLERPMSPFLFAYKPHLAMSMSLSHRVTGVAMSVAVTGASIIMLALPGDYTHYLELVKSLQIAPFIIYGCKYLLAWPISYHYINGFRHLAWDAGKGFALSTLYKTGYTAIALSFIVASMFVFLY